MSLSPAKKNDGFDPMSDLFVAQSSKPPHVSEINLRTLTSFQRSLLVIDGTVTKFIEAYTMEPVEIVRLGQSDRTLPEDHEWLEAPGGTAVMARQVMLQGKYSHIFHAYATSLIVPDRLGIEIKTGLDIDGGGIGRILLESRVETYREVLWYGKEHTEELDKIINNLNQHDFISRAYRIIANGKPIMLINEKFPLNNDWIPSHD